MKKYSQSSIWDSLVRIMPEFRDKIRKSPDYVDPTVAKSLYNVWRTGSSTDKSQRAFKKPATLSHVEVERMKNEGLILAFGDNLKITDKGQKIIKVMILGDDRSIFEDDGSPLDYNKALNHTKGIKTAKQRKVASTFWGQFDKHASLPPEKFMCEECGKILDKENCSNCISNVCIDCESKFEKE
jgi:hypothetical protein